jgi:regulatory protein
MKRSEMKRTEMKRRPGSSFGSKASRGVGPESDDGLNSEDEFIPDDELSSESAAEPEGPTWVDDQQPSPSGPQRARAQMDTQHGSSEPERGQARLDAQRGFSPEPERGQAWLDAERGSPSEPELKRSQAWLDAQRGFQPEPERNQAWLDAQRGYRPDAETVSGQARLDAERGIDPDFERPELEADPTSTSAVAGREVRPKPDQAWLDAQPEVRPDGEPGIDPGQARLDGKRGFRGKSGRGSFNAKRGFRSPSERGQAALDAKRGFEPESELERGQAALDAKRGFRSEPARGQAALDAQRDFRPETERRTRWEPLYSRNDPERPIGYDPERWAGFEPEDQADGQPTAPGDTGSSSIGPADNGPAGNGEGSGRRTGPGFGKRSGLGSGRRSDRPKKPRPQRTPEERAERTAQRQERAAKAVAADPTAAAKAIVLRQLTMGPRTRAQLRSAMARKDIPEDVANAVLDRFEQVDLVDDEEFSRQWVQSRHLGRGLARRALAHELRQRGVADETVKNAVDEVSPDDELTAARELVRRKAAGMQNDDPQRRIRRLAGMLARKGYGGGIAMQAIREELADLADAAEEAGLDFADGAEDG